MKQVTIPLDAEIANAYLKAKPQEQKKAQTLINLWLKEIFMTKTGAKKELFKTMDRIGAIAKANGLTPEILERLLNEKE